MRLPQFLLFFLTNFLNSDSEMQPTFFPIHSPLFITIIVGMDFISISLEKSVHLSQSTFTSVSQLPLFFIFFLHYGGLSKSEIKVL